MVVSPAFTVSAGQRPRPEGEIMSDSSVTVPGGGSTVAGSSAPALPSSFATASVVSVISPGQTVHEPTVNGGFITIDAGGTGVFTLMNGGFVSTFGTAEGGTLGGGFVEVFGGGLATHWKTDGGFIQVFAGGVASGDVIASIEQVGEASSGGGTAINEVIKSIQDVVNGGVASHTTIDARAFQDVSAGGIARATAVKKGGIETVVSGGIASGTTLSSGGELVISSGGSATLTTVKQGGTIDLATAPFVSGATASLNAKTDVLTIKDGGTTVSLKLAGKYVGEKFRVSENTTSVNSGSTNITVACFAAGTLIATARGEVPVEALTIGDRVATLGGGERPIVWVGQRRLDCRTHPRPELVWPIRVQAGAF
ncbi:MAG: Hint domain-containing protein, partial [Alphaproteobacteria bacterium]|nr:Hint domain-containing protein [Alphaproteobacteria bacterium]